MDTLPSGITASGGSRSALAVSGFRFRARLGFPIPSNSLRPARRYPRFWIRCSSSEHRRDFNPPEQCAAQRTLCPLLTSAPRSRALRRAPSVLGHKDPHGIRCRPPEVSSTTFRTPPPEFTSGAFDGYGLCGTLPARPPPAASYPVLVHWLVRLLALPSDPISRWQPLRFAILHLHQVGAGTFTRKLSNMLSTQRARAGARRLPPRLTAAGAPAGGAVKGCWRNPLVAQPVFTPTAPARRPASSRAPATQHP